MDVNGLHQCFASTLDVNPNIRRQAELQLSEASKAPGFIIACLDIVQAQPSSSVQVSAAVYLKNKVARNWEFDEYPNAVAINEAEKPAFRERLIPAIISAHQQTRQHLQSILNKVVGYDYPQKWPSFLEHTLQLLNSPDPQHIYAGLVCLSELCKAYRWRNHEARGDFEKVIQGAFPLALQVGNRLLTENNEMAGEMMRLVLKCYRAAIAIELSPVLRAQDTLVAWGNLMLQVVGKDLPADSVPEDEEDREDCPWWKAKKWAYRNLNRLFVKYGVPTSSSPDTNDEADMFAAAFAENFAPQILNAYLRQIDMWVGKTLWLSQPAVNSMLEYLDQSVRVKSTWTILKTHVESLVSQVVFPLLCLTQGDLDNFENEPVEYIHKRIDYFEQSPTADISATNFFVSLVEHRRKLTFNPVLAFINGVIVEQQQNNLDEAHAIRKEGALRMITSIAHVILGKKSPVAGIMESFFVTYVFPDFQSPYGFLRVRACELVNRFSEAEFKDPNNISFIYNSVVACLNDQYLPVQVEAALALQGLAQHESIKEAISANIKTIMGKFMELTKKIDIDSLISVMEEFVDMFSKELAPFAVELAEQLRDQFLRLLSEVLEKQNTEPENFDDSMLYPDYDDKAMAALGIVNTMTTLLMNLDHSPETVMQVEPCIFPVIGAILESGQTDMYTEAFDLIDSSSYGMKRISPSMWSLFGVLHQAFKTTAADYFDELLPAFENYVLYGAEEMKTNPTHINMFIDIINTVYEKTDTYGINDRISAGRLVQTMLINLRGVLDEYISYFIGVAMSRLGDSACQSEPKYLVSLLEIVICCIYYNPTVAFQILEERRETVQFFNVWFTNISRFTYVHDKKLSILAIVTVLSHSDEEIPASIRPGLPQIVHGLVELQKTLPEALKKRSDAQQFDDEETHYDDSGFLNTGDWDDEEDDDADNADADVQEFEGGLSYMDYLNKEAARMAEKDGEHAYSDAFLLDQDSDEMYQTILDSVNVNIAFKDMLHRNPARQEIFAGFQQEERAIVDSVLQQAYADEQALQAQQQQPAA
ncbi:armadillo-type protein [Limtongia smithiae]|uniref:armadillo-type protein n=1 Tax=Limtongia smithiae TaxID=1125753 RepID=UPI0034CE702C